MQGTTSSRHVTCTRSTEGECSGLAPSLETNPRLPTCYGTEDRVTVVFIRNCHQQKRNRLEIMPPSSITTINKINVFFFFFFPPFFLDHHPMLYLALYADCDDDRSRQPVPDLSGLVRRQHMIGGVRPADNQSQHSRISWPHGQRSSGLTFLQHKSPRSTSAELSTPCTPSYAVHISKLENYANACLC